MFSRDGPSEELKERAGYAKSSGTNEGKKSPLWVFTTDWNLADAARPLPESVPKVVRKPLPRRSLGSPAGADVGGGRGRKAKLFTPPLLQRGRLLLGPTSSSDISLTHRYGGCIRKIWKYWRSEDSFHNCLPKASPLFSGFPSLWFLAISRKEAISGTGNIMAVILSILRLKVTSQKVVSCLGLPQCLSR